jgi:hypothetical protein
MTLSIVHWCAFALVDKRSAVLQEKMLGKALNAALVK